MGLGGKLTGAIRAAYAGGVFHVEQLEREASGCRRLRTKMCELPAFGLEMGHISNLIRALNSAFSALFLRNVDPAGALN